MKTRQIMSSLFTNSHFPPSARGLPFLLPLIPLFGRDARQSLSVLLSPIKYMFRLLIPSRLSVNEKRHILLTLNDASFISFRICLNLLFWIRFFFAFKVILKNSKYCNV